MPSPNNSRLPRVTSPIRVLVRYRLAHVLYALTALGITFGWVVSRASSQRDAVRLLRHHGIAVYYKSDTIYKAFNHGELGTIASVPVSVLSDRPSCVGAGKDYFDTVTGVDFSANSNYVATGDLDLAADQKIELIKTVARLPQIQWVAIDHIVITPDLARVLAKCSSLECIHITTSSFSGNSLELLSSAASVRELIVDNCNITDYDLKVISALRNLHSLSLSGCPITDEGLSYLSTLRKLEVLHIAQARITLKGMEILASMPALREVSLLDGDLARQCLSTKVNIVDCKLPVNHQANLPENHE